MKNFIVLGIVLLCMVTVKGRHYGERSDAESSDDRDDQNDSFRRPRDRSANVMRHRRRSWQMNYGYEQQRPQLPDPYFSDNRRDYAMYNQQDLYPQIIRLLDEIATYVKRPQMPPPPPPQPIYIPYPLPYPIPQKCSCPSSNNVPNPNITSRFPDMEDPNQNWGFVRTDEDNSDDGDGSRPISFVPIVPKHTPKRRPPKVDHGSSQAGVDASRVLRAESDQVVAPLSKAPGTCDVFALSCCTGTSDQQRQCFNNVGCSAAYDNGNACRQDKLLAIIDDISKAYSPVN